MGYSTEVIREFIIEVFTDQELTLFCEDYFKPVVPQFGDGINTVWKARILVRYCERVGEIPVLLEKLKEKRSTRYEEYRERLEMTAEEGTSPIEKMQAAQHAYADVLKELISDEAPLRSSAEEQSSQPTDHPLAGDEKAVKNWFLGELAQDEQVFV